MMNCIRDLFAKTNKIFVATPCLLYRKIAIAWIMEIKNIKMRVRFYEDLNAWQNFH